MSEENSTPHEEEPTTIVSAESTPAPTTTIVLQHQDHWLRRILCWVAWIGLFIAVVWIVYDRQVHSDYFDTSAGLTERYHSGASLGRNKIAVIYVTGLIVDGDSYVKQQIDRIKYDDDVRAIVLRINSPGGTVTGSDYMLHHLQRLREETELPLVVSMGSIAASGGYYVAMAVGDDKETIFAEPTTTTGSIGVIIPHYDVSGFMAQHGIKDDSIKSHPRKQMLAMTRPISDDHREILEGYVNESFEHFKEVVKQGRPAFRRDTEALDQLATGEIFSAKQALKVGLVDKIGFIEEAIERAIELANVDEEDARVVYYARPAYSLESFAGLATARQRSELQTLFELSTPRAYYLASSLPPLLTNRDLYRNPE